MTADPGREAPEPLGLRRLRRLVTALTATLIVGMALVAGLLVWRLVSFETMSAPALPPSLALPAGEVARAVTLGTGWIAVVTRDAAGTERIRVFDAPSGAPRAVVDLTPAP